MATSLITRTDHLAIAKHVAASPDDWPLAPRFNPQQRWSHRLECATDFEVWLLTWLPGQGTDVHDHGGSAGAFTVVSGELTEETYSGGRAASALMSAGVGRRFGAHHVHRVVNLSPRPAVSIHVYGPGLTSMTRYRIERDELVVDAIERAGEQW
jgi:predicted metal-dependent enzyme (double-stranded beta helix superfamily)